MNKCFLIFAELKNSTCGYMKFKKSINAYTRHVKIMNNCWAILSEKDATEIWESLSSTVYADDRVLVVRTEGNAAWHNVSCSNVWLQSNLGARLIQ